MENRIENFYLGSYDKVAKSYKNFDTTLLLVIDIQDKLLPVIYESEKILKKTLTVLDTFNMLNIKSIATEQYPKGLGRSHKDILKRIPEKNIFFKTSFNAVTNEIESYLKANKIKNIIITGVEAHICVFQTVRELVSLGYNIFVVEDAISSYKSEQKELALKAFDKMGAKIINTEMLLFDLINDSKNENFKAVSTLVKELRR